MSYICTVDFGLWKYNIHNLTKEDVIKIVNIAEEQIGMNVDYESVMRVLREFEEP